MCYTKDSRYEESDEVPVSSPQSVLVAVPTFHAQVELVQGAAVIFHQRREPDSFNAKIM